MGAPVEGRRFLYLAGMAKKVAVSPRRHQPGWWPIASQDRVQQAPSQKHDRHGKGDAHLGSIRNANRPNRMPYRQRAGDGLGCGRSAANSTAARATTVAVVGLPASGARTRPVAKGPASDPR
jgi:hypothetical protein